MQHLCRAVAISAIASIATATYADTVELEAVLNTSAQSIQTSALMSLDQFLDTGERLSERGMRIFDMETVMIDGDRRYIGLWRPGGGFSRFVGPIGASDFGQLVREMRSEDRRLEDFEIFRTASGGRRYLGLWRNGAGEEVLTGPMPLEAFDARGKNLAEDGVSLVDLEVETFNGNTLYHGLFRTEVGAATNQFTPAMTRRAFVAERDTRVADGWHLVDMETIEPDGEALYAGVWRKGGTGPSRISALRTLEEFRDFSVDQLAKGREPIDLELRRIVPKGDPPPPTGNGPTTDDLPDLPDWLVLKEGSGEVIVTFDPNTFLTDDGLLIEMDRSLLPMLPTKPNGEVVFPDNICGFRIFQPSSVKWTNIDGDDIEDGQHLSHSSFPAGTPEATAAMSGLDFTGPFGACAGSTENWRFMHPLHVNSEGGPPFRRIIFDLPEGMAFLNHTISLENPFDGAGLKPEEYFKPEIMELLKEITQGFLEEDEENGYCKGVLHYMQEICGADAQNCPFKNLEDIDLIGAC